MTVLEAAKKALQENNYALVFELLDTLIIPSFYLPNYNRFKQVINGGFQDMNTNMQMAVFIGSLDKNIDRPYNPPVPQPTLNSKQEELMLNKTIYLDYKQNLSEFQASLDKKFTDWESTDDKLNFYAELYKKLLPYITAYNNWLNSKGADVTIPTLTLQNPHQEVRKQEELDNRIKAIKAILNAIADIDEDVSASLLGEIKSKQANSGLNLFKNNFLGFLKSKDVKNLYDSIEEVDRNIRVVYEELGHLDKDLQVRFQEVWIKIMGLYNEPAKNKLSYKGDFYDSITTTNAISTVLSEVHKKLFNTREELFSGAIFNIGVQNANNVTNISHINTFNNF